MYKFNWDGNDGRCFPKPGEVAQVQCGICATPMNVERNVNAPTGYVEALARRAHLHDCFTCPHLEEAWHKRINSLKMKAYSERSYYYSLLGRESEETLKIKSDMEEKAKKILEEREDTMDPKLIRVPAKVKKMQERYAELEALYPRDLAREMVKAYMDAIPPLEDAVILPGMNEDELEADMAQLEDREEFAAAIPEQLAEYEKMKQGFRDIHGKKWSELPPLTPEEDAAYLEEEVDNAITEVLLAWANTLHTSRKELGGADGVGISLADTFEPVISIRFGTGSKKTWWQVPCRNTMLTPEQVGKLHEAFAEKLRPLVDAALPNGYVLWDEFVIRKEARGYYLCFPPTPDARVLAKDTTDQK